MKHIRAGETVAVMCLLILSVLHKLVLKTNQFKKKILKSLNSESVYRHVLRKGRPKTSFTSCRIFIFCNAKPMYDSCATIFHCLTKEIHLIVTFPFCLFLVRKFVLSLSYLFYQLKTESKYWVWFYWFTERIHYKNLSTNMLACSALVVSYSNDSS